MRGFILAAALLGTLAGMGRSQAVEVCKPPGSETNKCFALLVGVNEYAQSEADDGLTLPPLKGPGNDVGLMKELLISQFGFEDDASHILSLVGAKATHKAILDGLTQHLIRNAERFPGAKVIFYFSGHGSQLTDSEGTTGSGYHQTLLAYDSRSHGGSDIIDDELNAHLEVLSKYTDQITLIFDSCHSGSVWRDVTTMASKSAPSRSVDFSKVSFRSKPRDLEGTIRPGGGEYSVVVAAPADELAVEAQVPTADGLKYHGLLTFYLDKAIRSSAQLTYDQLAKRVAVEIASIAPSQHPQAEGDINRIFLGSFSERVPPYIDVLAVLDTKKAKIGAGLADGLHDGAIVAFYAKDSQAFGDEGKLGNARVSQASDFTSIVELVETPKSAVALGVKVRIVTPFASSGRTSIFLPSITGNSSGQKEASAFLAEVRHRLSQNQLLSITKDPSHASILVRWDCNDDDEARSSSGVLLLAQPTDVECSSGYKFFLSLPDRPYHLFNFTVGAGGDAASLVTAAENRVRQENLRSLENRVSGIRGEHPRSPPLSIKIEEVAITTVPGALPAVTTKRLSEQGVPQLHIDEHFRLRITNDSPKTLFIVVAWIGSGGGIGLFAPARNGDKVLPGNTLITWPPLRVGAPEGLETYKVIATTRPDVDFRVLNQPGISKGDVGSPLEWLLNQTGNTSIRDRNVGAELALGDWVTAQRDVFIVH